jgi:hypothetical protein
MILIAIIEVSVVLCFLMDAVFLGIAMQIIPVGICCITMIDNLRLYKRRKQFILYFTRIEDVVDFLEFNSKCYICDTDEYGILFVRNEKDKLIYDDWSKFSEFSTSDIEKTYFGDVFFTAKKVR